MGLIERWRGLEPKHDDTTTTCQTLATIAVLHELITYGHSLFNRIPDLNFDASSLVDQGTLIGVKTVVENWCSGPRQLPLPEMTLCGFSYYTVHVNASVRACTMTYQACLRHGAVLSDEAEYAWRFYSPLNSRLHHFTSSLV
jgi:hypothetical protein